jgi:hypothetical protein
MGGGGGERKEETVRLIEELDEALRKAGKAGSNKVLVILTTEEIDRLILAGRLNIEEVFDEPGDGKGDGDEQQVG